MKRCRQMRLIPTGHCDLTGLHHWFLYRNLYHCLDCRAIR